MEFHGVDVKTQFKRMRELAPEVYRAFLEFDQKAFKDGAIPAKTKELIALGIAQITQCCRSGQVDPRHARGHARSRFLPALPRVCRGRAGRIRARVARAPSLDTVAVTHQYRRS